MTESRPKHQWVKPDGSPQRYCSFTQLAKHLKISHKQLRAHCTALAIYLQPGKRNDRYPSGRLQRKRYKRHLRFLTQSETTRILVRHYELVGARIQRRKEPA